MCACVFTLVTADTTKTQEFSQRTLPDSTTSKYTFYLTRKDMERSISEKTTLVTVGSGVKVDQMQMVKKSTLHVVLFYSYRYINDYIFYDAQLPYQSCYQQNSAAPSSCLYD